MVKIMGRATMGRAIMGRETMGRAIMGRARSLGFDPLYTIFYLFNNYNIAHCPHRIYTI